MIETDLPYVPGTAASTKVTPKAGAIPTPMATPLQQVEESDIESLASSVHPLAAKSNEEKLEHLTGQLDGAGQGHLL